MQACHTCVCVRAHAHAIAEALIASDIGVFIRIHLYIHIHTHVSRQGRSFDVEIVRSSVAFVREMERLCWLLEEHAQLIKRYVCMCV